jgi:hypothetical protein
VLERLPGRDRDAQLVGDVAGRAEQPRLADTGRAGEDVAAARAGRGVLQRLPDDGQLGFPPEDLVLHDLGPVGSSAVDLGSVEFGLVEFGLVEFGLVEFGLVEFGLVEFGVVEPGLVEPGVVGAGSMELDPAAIGPAAGGRSAAVERR